MGLRLPAAANIRMTSEDDPAPYYYRPLLRYPYKKRLRIALGLMGERRFDSLLDIGYGSGVFFPELSRRCGRLTGLDLHRSGALVRGMMRREGLRGGLGVGDVCRLPLRDEAFDGVVCLSVLEFVEDLGEALDEIHRVMAPGGLAVLGAPVLNRVTGLAYERLIRHMKHKDQHKSDHRRILREAGARFEIVEEKRFLPGMPRDYAFFFCISCRKAAR